MAQIQLRPERFIDRCVTVTGAYAGIRMYGGRDGMYLAFRLGRDGNFVPASRVNLIGIDNQQMRNLRMRYPQRTTVTGRVDTCERRRARIEAAGAIPFMGGYCHYDGGPTIVVDAYDITQERYERMTGEAARLRFGNLARMPADWPARVEVEALAVEFLQALRAGDWAKLATLNEVSDTDQQGRSTFSSLMQNPEFVFAQIRRTASPQTEFFVSAAEDGTPLGRESTGATICFCRTSDCTGRWPIALNDANNEPDRPYACTKAEPREFGPRRVVLNTRLVGGWVTEPMATAHRRSANSSTR